MSHTLKHIFKWYKGEVKRPVATEKEFRDIWNEYLEIVIEEIILEGGYITLPGKMGDFRIVRRRRNPKHLTPNWGATNKAKADGTYTGVIYFTDPFWFKYQWKKSRCFVKNKSIWNFKPTRGAKGLKTRLTNHLENDDLAYLKYQTYGNI